MVGFHKPDINPHFSRTGNCRNGMKNIILANLKNSESRNCKPLYKNPEKAAIEKHENANK